MYFYSMPPICAVAHRSIKIGIGKIADPVAEVYVAAVTG
jgi:hypothetical protein